MKVNLASVLFITAALFLSAETTFRPEWGSLLFLIPNQLTDLGRKCATKSSHYCLDCYRTFHSKAEDGDYETNIDYDASFPTQEIVTEFGVKVAEIYEKINFFSDLMSENCCEDQTAKYILHGYMNRNMTPDDYLDKLTDYTDEHLGINFIGVHYDEERCLNVITEIGFGDPPFLQFPPITSSNGGFDKPYVFPPQPGFEPLILTLQNLRARWRFGWFKHNIMCKDQPWICE